MKRYLKSFLLFLKTKKFPTREDLVALRDAPLSSSKAILVILSILVLGLFLNLLLAIINTLTIEVPDYGGTITEGVIGAPKFINPLLSTSETDKALSSLVYASIVDVAKECVASPDGKSYQCVIPEKSDFSDKGPLTSADILFTFTTKKTLETSRNPESDWRNISVETPNSSTIRISTTGDANALTEKMSLGIVPKILWEGVPIESIEDSSLNLRPVGAGPFKIANIAYTNSLPTEITLVPNSRYSGSKPYLKRLLVHSYTNQLDLVSALHSHEINSTTALKSDYVDPVIENNFSIRAISSPKSVGLWVSQSASESTIAQKLEYIGNKIDRNKILDTIEHGYGIPLYSKETTRSNKVANKATEETISIAVQKDTELLEIAEMLSVALGELDILSTIQVFDQGLFIDQVRLGQYPFILVASQDAIPGYQRLIPLYTKSFIHLTSHDIHTITPEVISSPYQSLSKATSWYTRTDKIWKWFTQK